MRIVDPIGTSAAAAKVLAARPRSLEGVTIALLDNSKPNAGALLERVGALLAARGGAHTVRAWSKPGASTGASAALIEEIAAAARVALTASADWGSCTSWSVHDAAELEARGVSCVVLGTDEFIQLTYRLCKRRPTPGRRSASSTGRSQGVSA